MQREPGDRGGDRARRCDDTLRLYTVESLHELGYRVLAASDGAAALALIDEQDVDLLFTDIVMPGG